MKLKKLFLSIGVFSLLFVFTQCENDEFPQIDNSVQATELNAKGEKDITTSDEEVGNNLSFPVIWSDGATKVLRGEMGKVTLTGTWWGVWGEDPIDPNAPLFSAGPYVFGETVYDERSEYKAYVQKDSGNEWQASNWIPNGETVVDNIDWGDNLESINWNLTSQIRTEVVLYKNVNPAVTEYAMRHTESWGEDENHGLQTTLANDIVYGPGDIATVFTSNARLTIQKLSVENLDDVYELDDKGERTGTKLKWRPDLGWTEAEGYEGGDLVNDEPVFNQAVHQASDGPGYYNAEVNVKGKIIFGYTWNAKKRNEGVGYYRLTFSFDEDSGQPLKTFFNSNTKILLPIEETEETEVAGKKSITTTVSGEEGDSGEGSRGGKAFVDSKNNLTYMDILIISKTTGSGGSGGSGTGGSGTGGSDTGGSGTSGSGTSGSDTGGSDTGGSGTGDSDTGGSDTGGSDTSGSDTGGSGTGGSGTGDSDTSDSDTSDSGTGGSDTGDTGTGGSDTSGSGTGDSDTSDSGTGGSGSGNGNGNGNGNGSGHN